MRSISELQGAELTWSQPNGLKQEFRLESSGQEVATLDFRSSFGSFATGRTAEGSWTFKRVGFWRTSVTIRDAATDREIGRFRNATWSDGGTLELADGRQFHASTNLWMTRYEFHNDRDEAFLAFVRIRGVVHLSSRVEFTPDAARLAELPLLVVLGWYLTVGMHNDAGAAAAAAAAG